MHDRTDKLLAALAFLAWAVAGAPRFGELAQTGELPLVWLALYLGFGVCLGLALFSPPPRALAFTVAQAVLAVSLLAVGMPHFEGALLAVVAAQLRTVVAARVAWLWILAQAVPLAVAILPSHGPFGTAKATLEYAAFGIFAMTLFDLRHRERERRLDLARVHAELLGTRALLRETVRYAEQTRIRRDLHDSLGQHLAALSIQLDLAADDPLHIGRARSALMALQDSARDAIAGARPDAIDLAGALASLAGATPAMRLRFDVEPLRDLDPDAAWTVFRMAQEAITNAYKHGGARELRLTATGEVEGWTVRIENDGRPVRGELRMGQGLSGMRERLEAIGARLAIETADGFALVASIPRRSTNTP